MPVLLHGVSQRIPSRSWTAENLQFATAVTLEPLDAPLAGCSAIFENLGWFTQSPSVPSPQLWASSPTSRHDQRVCRSCRLARSVERDCLETASVARALATFSHGLGIPQLSICAQRRAWATPDGVTLWLTHGSARRDFRCLAWR